jgi:hypothetical protein
VEIVWNPDGVLSECNRGSISEACHFGVEINLIALFASLENFTAGAFCAFTAHTCDFDFCQDFDLLQ